MTMNIPGTGAIEWLDVHHKTILKTDEIGGAISLVGSPTGPSPPLQSNAHHVRKAP